MVSGNYLETLPEELGNLKNIQELNIARNKFNQFPQVVLKLKSLRALWINSNSFSSFPSPEILRKLTNLRSLYCFGFPKTEQTDKNLDYLKLSRIRGNTLKQLQKMQINKNKKTTTPTLAKKPNNVKNVSKKVNIFISYSHRDTEWLDRVKVHLKSLNFENNKLEVWDDSRISAGSKWKEEITNALKKCRIAILLVSAYFLASDFIINEELPTLLEEAETKGTKILPLIILPCRFLSNKSLSHFQAVNDPKIPLSKLSLSEQEEILLKLTNDVEAYLE